MSSANPYSSPDYGVAVAHAGVDDRADFITKTYLHLFGAVGILVLMEAALLNSGIADDMVRLMMGGRFSWMIVLGLFMAVSHIADRWARSNTSVGMQYAGLALYTVAEAVILLPLLYIAKLQNPSTITTAAVATLGLFGVLTAIVFATRKDFSFMRSALMFGGVAAMGLIVCAMLFNFSLGPIFSVAMIALMCGYILYHTSNVLHHYAVGQHVAASLSLFASLATLFWYVLQLVMASDD